MKVLISPDTSYYINKATHWCIGELKRWTNPEFHETILKPIGEVDITRSIVASQFLKAKEYDLLFLLNNNVVFNPIDVVRIVKSISNDKSIIGACFPQESNMLIPSCKFKNGQIIRFSSDAPLVEVESLSSGFMFISKCVFERLSKKIPFCGDKTNNFDFWPFFQPIPIKIGGGLFSPEWEYLAGDKAFCYRAKQAGFDVWLDPSINIEYIGQKYYRLEDMFELNAKKEEIVKLSNSGIIKEEDYAQKNSEQEKEIQKVT